MATSQPLLDLETVLLWARSGHESDKVYRFLFLYPDDFFTIPVQRTWPIAHQVVYNGDVFLLRRILALFNDEQIDIRKLSKDRKTLLDAAKERQTDHPDMYNYVENLFLRDDLIKAAKKNKWDVVQYILRNKPELANEKPPYSTYFLLHYLVQNGDKNLLQQLFQEFQFDTNVYSADVETPLDIAERLKLNDICSILKPTTKERFDTNLIKSRVPLPSDQTSSASATSTRPYPKVNRFPSIDFSNNSLTITNAGNYGLEKKSLFAITQTELHPPDQQRLYPTLKPDDRPEDIDTQDISPNSGPPPTTPITVPSKLQLIKNLTCPLIGQIMVDPVIASDGQTYEREAIAEYVRIYQCSPLTGAIMDATFKDNVELKQIIQKMRK